LQSRSNDIKTAEQVAKDALINAQTIEDALKDSVNDLRERAIDAVNYNLEKQISIQEE
jgi:hypothetical protein